jgi:hypothetical protein
MQSRATARASGLPEKSALPIFSMPILFPGGGPFTALINSNGTLTQGQCGSANNVNPMTMAIDPTGSLLYQIAQGFGSGTQSGLFVYAINRTDGTRGTAIGSYLTGQALAGHRSDGDLFVGNHIEPAGLLQFASWACRLINWTPTGAH